jgi:hypothetical protein
MSDAHAIRQVRIDVPLQAGSAYLFLSREDAEKWDPWWGSLYEHLLKLAPLRPIWKYEPVQNTFFVRPSLTSERRLALAAFLRSAPRREIEGHRTLRLAVGLTPAQVMKLKLMFFADGPTLTN